MKIKFLYTFIIVFVIVLGVGGFLLSNFANNFEDKSLSEQTFVVKDKYVKQNPVSDQDQYLVYGSNNQTYKITDTVSRTNSTDLYNYLEIGKRYTFLVEGKRNSEISEYPNLLKIIEE